MSDLHGFGVDLELAQNNLQGEVCRCECGCWDPFRCQMGCHSTEVLACEVRA